MPLPRKGINMRKLLLITFMTTTSLTALANESMMETGNIEIIDSICTNVYSNSSGYTAAYKCFKQGVQILKSNEDIARDQLVHDLCTTAYSNTSGHAPGYKCFIQGMTFLEGRDYKIVTRTCDRVYAATSGYSAGYTCYAESMHEVINLDMEDM
jgi:hypothetical protein